MSDKKKLYYSIIESTLFYKKEGDDIYLWLGPNAGWSKRLDHSIYRDILVEINKPELALRTIQSLCKPGDDFPEGYFDDDEEVL